MKTHDLLLALGIVLAGVAGCNGLWLIWQNLGGRTIYCQRCGSYISGRNRRKAQSEFALHMREVHGEEWMP